MMRKLLFLLILILGIGLFGSFAHGGIALAAIRSRKVCTTSPTVGTAQCDAIIITDGSGVTPLATSGPQGYGPATFKAAYRVHSNGITHVGIVVAYDAPNIQSDLTTFSKTFGLPILPSCATTTQTSCFEKFNQRGTTAYPAANSSWAVETSLDVESVHGMCPGCRISLIEATSASMDNLSAAVDEAVVKGAKLVSNSYGGPESTGEAAYDSHYHKAGITMVVSSGDNGYGTDYPAVSPYVVAVGGTTLKMNGSRVSSETVWDGAGSGCSQFESKPTWQTDKKCVRRSVSDVAADADPNTGAAIYDSYSNGGHSGWFTVGGTSLAAPLVAGIIATSSHVSNEPAFLYGNTSLIIRDIISGNNGGCSTYLCRAGNGYDGPSGLGVLSGL